MDLNTAKSISQIMSLMVARGGFNIWPDLLPFLTGMLSKEHLMELAIHTISIIVEDCDSLFQNEKFSDLITNMYPQICKLVSVNYSQTIIENAINTLNMLVQTGFDIIIDNLSDYLLVLIDMGTQIYAKDPKGTMKVQHRLIQGITVLLDYQLDQIMEDQFEPVADIMVKALQHLD